MVSGGVGGTDHGFLICVLAVGAALQQLEAVPHLCRGEWRRLDVGFDLSQAHLVRPGSRESMSSISASVRSGGMVNSYLASWSLASALERHFTAALQKVHQGPGT